MAKYKSLARNKNPAKRIEKPGGKSVKGSILRSRECEGQWV